MSSSPDENPALSLADLWLKTQPWETLSWAQIQQISPAALAYLGDAVYELYIRSYYLMPPKRLDNYHHQVVARVRAESQARHLLQIEPHLSSTELEILRRGRNAANGRPKRVSPQIYQQATSLETLVGYLYLSDRPRLNELLAHSLASTSEEATRD